MAVNSYQVTRKVAIKMLDVFMNKTVVVKKFNSKWAGEFGENAKIGDQLLVPRPQRWTVTDGAQRGVQPIDMRVSRIVIDRDKNIGFDYTLWDERLFINDIYEKYFKTQVPQAANSFDDDACGWAYTQTNNVQGTLGTNPSTLFDSQNQMLLSAVQLKEKGYDGDILAVLGLRQSANAQAYLNQQFNPSGKLSRQYDTGDLQTAFGFNSIETDQNVRTHQSGTFTGTPLVNGAPVNGASSLVTDGWTAGDTLLAGDWFSIAGQNAINTLNRRSLGYNLRLLVLADCVADPGGNMTIPFSVGGDETLQGPGQYANCDALAADNAALTILPGTTSPTGKSGVQGLAFGDEAFLVVPITYADMGQFGLWGASVRDPKTGMSMSISRQGDIDTNNIKARMSWGYGFGTAYANEESVRIVGA